MMRVAVGGSLVWRERQYEVLFIRQDSVALRDDDGEEVEVSIDELSHRAEPAKSITAKLAEAVHAEEDADPSLGPWHEAIQRIEGTESGGIVEAVATEARWLSSRLGKPVSVRSVNRRLRAFREHGVEGLADQRGAAFASRRPSSVDPVVVEALRRELTSRASSSTINRAVVIDRVTRRVRQEHGDSVQIPSRATFYRLLDSEDRGRFFFKSAKTRESLALQPDRAFGSRTALRPGELVEMDSTRIDVMMRIDETTIGRPELTILMDVATRSILAAILRPEGTKSVDLLVALARALVPYARRLEGVRETRRLISTAWAEDALIDQERLDRYRLAQPFIFPETITTDRGRNYLSKHFRSACETLGISLIRSAPHTPTDKPHVERAFGSINSLFLQHAKGYVGRSVEHRGRDVEAQSEQLLTIAQAQELLDDWIAVEWQNRSHSGLRDPLHPKITLSPNEMCRAFRAVAPELHIPLTRNDFIALLPIIHRRVNRYGVTIDHRIYDSKMLAEFRRKQSPSKTKQGRWPIRVDPYNLHVVWLEVDGEFIPLRWNNDIHEMPMLGDVWRHARTEYRTRGDKINDDRVEITSAMKQFAAQGNPKRTARRAARAAAVANDPMNMTTARLAEPEHPSGDDVDVTPQTESGGEEWPNRGGFPFIGDAIDEVRRRVEE